jgi:D-2-hydroxyacid dehydrogenase (NADP+)
MKILILDEYDNPDDLRSAIAAVDRSIELVYAIDENGDIDDGLYGEHVSTADVLVVGRFTEQTLVDSKCCKWVHCTSAGVDRLLFKAFLDSSVVLTNSRGIHPVPIAEHIFGCMLCFEKKLMVYIRQQQDRVWEKERAAELYGRTLGIIGVGRIGQRVAEIGKVFGCHVLGVRRTDAPVEGIDRVYTTLEPVLRESDYVILCLPSTPDTKNIIGREEIAAMKSEAVVINIGRGEAIDDEALLEALSTKRIRGAALDVFVDEPLSKDSPYYDLENVLITPHSSGSTLRYDERGIEILVDNLGAYLEKRQMPTLVDKIAGY